MSFLIAQVNSPKKLDERDFSLVIGNRRERSDNESKARFEAQSIRDSIETGDRGNG